MSETADNLSKMLLLFGLAKEVSQVYLFISKNGPSTALKISKQLNIGRTKVYRILDTLIAKGFVNQNLGARGFLFEATDPINLKSIIAEKETELTNLKASFTNLIENMSQLPLRAGDTDSSKVTYYKGAEGLKQVTWNSLRAERDLYIYEVNSDMSKFIDPKFSEEIRRELLRRRIHTSQLTNLKHIPKHTKVKELVQKYWEVRYLNPKELPIDFEVLIYNDVVALYNVRGKDLFCVEIHDKRLAKMQKQIFKFVWKSARKMQIVGGFGEAVLS